MAQEIKQGNIFGRIGSGIGQGLAEQLPKEIERGRLASGLQQLEQESGNLTPMQFFTRAISQPGVTPQMVQSLAELSKQQNIRSAYGKGRRGTQDEFKQGGVSSGGQNIQPNMMPNQQSQMQNGQPTENVKPEEFGQPQVQQKNPLREAAVPRKPWTPERRNEERGRLFEDFPWMNNQEIDAMASDNEKRYLAEPEAEQAQDTYLNQVKTGLQEKFRNQLATKLQKNKEGIFESVSGEDLINLERGMERELRTNPKATEDDVINKWTKKALEMAKTKTQLNKLANSNNPVSAVLKKNENLNKLKEYGDIYRNAGNSEEYFNTLKSEFKFSPSGAAWVAYPINKNLKSYLENSKKQSPHTDHASNSRKIAADIEKFMTSDDSYLSVARELKHKDPNFDERAFFEQLSQDKDLISNNPRQRRELAEGVSDILPSWGDFLYLPFFRGI